MKRLIILKNEYAAPSAPVIKQFRADLKKSTILKFVEEYPPKPWVVIEFPDNQLEAAHDELRAMDIVQIIDNTLPIKGQVLEPEIIELPDEKIKKAKSPAKIKKNKDDEE